MTREEAIRYIVSNCDWRSSVGSDDAALMEMDTEKESTWIFNNILDKFSDLLTRPDEEQVILLKCGCKAYEAFTGSVGMPTFSTWLAIYADNDLKELYKAKEHEAKIAPYLSIVRGICTGRDWSPSEEEMCRIATTAAYENWNNVLIINALERLCEPL